MISAEKDTCNCELNKEYNPNDEICQKCKTSQKVLDKLFDVAVESGNVKLLTTLITAMFLNK